jgi:hypothetical protein
MLAEKFADLYQGLKRAHGGYTLSNTASPKGKAEGRAVTLFEEVTIEKWRAHLSGTAGIGIVPINEDNKCWWGAVDIDVYEDGLLAKIEEATRRLALPVVCLRTKSGGVHVTCFLTEPVDARIVRGKMMEIAAALGYSGVEVFPKQTRLAGEKDCGNWLNMPYFNAENSNRYALYKNQQLTAEQFTKLAEALRCTPEQLVALEVSEGSHFSDGPPCLQTIAQNGGLGMGGRNEGLFAMGVYCRLKHPDSWEAELDTLNQELVTPPLSSKEVQMLVKSLGRKEYFYPCAKPPISAFCNKEACKHRQFGIGQDNQAPSVDLGRLVKICTDPPTWIIDVEGARFELETEDLMSQTKFAKLCIERINIWPTPVRPQVWQRLVQERLTNVELIEAPKEASTDGRFLWHLEQFCTTTAFARSKDELLLGKPFTENGRHFFRSEDLMRYLYQHHFRDLTARRAWSLLRSKASARHEQFQLKGKCVQCWSVNEFQKQTEEFDATKNKEEF